MSVSVDIKRELEVMVDCYTRMADLCKKELEENNGKLLPVERTFDRASLTIYTCVARDLQRLVRQLDPQKEDSHD